MCNCISNIRQKLGVGTECNGKEIERIEIVEAGNIINWMTGEDYGERIQLEMKIHFKNKKSKSIKQPLPVNYCPFCGQPYREDLYDYHIPESQQKDKNGKAE